MKKSQIKNLDSLWSKKVHSNAKEKCQSCGKSKSQAFLNACHVIGRAHRSTRWGCFIEENGKLVYILGGFCGCYLCHKQYDSHGPKEAFIRKNVIKEDVYEKIRQQAEKIADNQDFETIKKLITGCSRNV